MGHIRNCCPKLAPPAAMGAVGMVEEPVEDEVVFNFATTAQVLDVDSSSGML